MEATILKWFTYHREKFILKMGLASIVISPKILSSMPVLPLTTQRNLPEQNLENHNQSKLSGSNRILWEINDWAHGSKTLLNVTICVWAHATSPIFRGRFASPKYLYQCYIPVEILYVKIIKASLKVYPRFLARKIQISLLFVYFHRFKNSNYSIWF